MDTSHYYCHVLTSAGFFTTINSALWRDVTLLSLMCNLRNKNTEMSAKVLERVQYTVSWPPQLAFRYKTRPGVLEYSTTFWYLPLSLVQGWLHFILPIAYHLLLLFLVTLVVHSECNVIIYGDELPLEDTPRFRDLTSDLLHASSPNYDPFHLLPAGLSEVSQVVLWGNVISVVGDL